jgi:hypothetical protein
MKKIIIFIIIVIVVVVGYFIFKSILSPEKTNKEGANSCEVDSDCVIFGQDGDCNCGCFNKNYDWSAGGKCFCAAPRACECVEGTCERVYEE